MGALILLTIYLDLIGDRINSPMGPGDEMIVPGDLEGSYNIISSIWSVEGKVYGYIYDNWGLII